MKRREPPLTSSGVRRRARISLEKRLHDIAEGCQNQNQLKLTKLTQIPSQMTHKAAMTQDPLR